MGEDGEETATKITLNIHWKKSIVSEVRVAAGKQYDGISDDSTSAVVSQKSGVTSQFVLNDTASMDNLWLELRVDSTENAIALPAGTQMILLKDNTFYTYQVKGTESNNRIQLSDFKEMWGTGSPTGMSQWETNILLLWISAQELGLALENIVCVCEMRPAQMHRQIPSQWITVQQH